MKSKYKEYCVGIDFGTSNSLAGIYLNGTVRVAPNKIGERTTPSIVLFTNNKAKLVGEEALNNKSEELNSLVYEVKRFIGLNYEEFEEDNFKKYLNYEIENVDGIPKVKIIINGKVEYKSAEEISSLVIKKVVQNAEDFIAETQNIEGLKITKAIITVPAHFNENQKNAVRSAAKMAGIEIPRIINEPTAAALAYGLGHDLIAENPLKSKRETLIGKENQTEFEVAPLVSENFKSEEKVIVFDLGGGTFDITLLNIKKNSEGQLIFEVELTNGDIHLGGSDFDNMLIDYCIKEFCRRTEVEESEIRKDKRACQRLKIKCENAKKLLSIKNETIINVDNFYKDEDLCVKMTLSHFENLCKDLFDRVNNIINEVLEEVGLMSTDIDNVILVGGATRMVGIKNLLKKIFTEDKIKDNVNPDEAVAIGATLEAAKMEINDKMNFVLQDIVPYNLGLAVMDPNDLKNGDVMVTIIKKYSKIPCSSEKSFSSILNDKNNNITLKIYEGNDKYANKNTKLGEFRIDNINATGKIEYKIKFVIDVNGELIVQYNSDSLGINKEQTFRNITHAIKYDKKIKIKISENKNISSIANIVRSISQIKDSIVKNFSNPGEKYRYLIDGCQSYEELIDNYQKFSGNNESAYEKIYEYTKELFYLYLERIKLKNITKDNVKEIINQIKEKMKVLISIIGYVEELLLVFLNIRDTHKNEFYEILVNFLELLNNEGIERKKKKKFSRYYSKLYFEKVFYVSKKYLIESDLFIIDKAIKEKYEKVKASNEEELKKVNSFTNFIETKIKEGKFLFGQTGFTSVGKKIEQFEQNMKVEDVQDILDLFHNMADSFDKKENSLAEAYCLANIIKINYKIYHITDYDKLCKYIDRFETIMDGREDENLNWYKEAKEIINEINENI